MGLPNQSSEIISDIYRIRKHHYNTLIRKILQEEHITSFISENGISLSGGYSDNQTYVSYPIGSIVTGSVIERPFDYDFYLVELNPEVRVGDRPQFDLGSLLDSVEAEKVQ